VAALVVRLLRQSQEAMVRVPMEGGRVVVLDRVRCADLVPVVVRGEAGVALLSPGPAMLGLIERGYFS